MCITIVYLHNPNFHELTNLYGIILWFPFLRLFFLSPDSFFLASYPCWTLIIPIYFVWKCVILSYVNLDIILLFIPRYIYDQLSSSLIGHLSVSKKWDNDMRWVMTYERSKEMRRDYDMRWHMRVPKKWEEIIIWLAGE